MLFYMFKSIFNKAIKMVLMLIEKEPAFHFKY